MQIVKLETFAQLLVNAFWQLVKPTQVCVLPVYVHYQLPQNNAEAAAPLTQTVPLVIHAAAMVYVLPLSVQMQARE
jgi:hypothetical protein